MHSVKIGKTSFSSQSRFGVVKSDYLHESYGVLYGELKRLVEKPGLKVAKAYKVACIHVIITL